MQDINYLFAIISLAASLVAVLANIANIVQGFESLLNILERMKKPKEKVNVLDRTTNKTAGISIPKLRLSQKNLGEFFVFLSYLFPGLFLSLGVDYFTKLFEDSIFRYILNFVVIVLIWTAPYELRRMREARRNTLPIKLSWILAIIFGFVGTLIRYNLITYVKPALFLAVVYVILIRIIEISLLWHLLLNSFSPWFKKLPEK